VSRKQRRAHAAISRSVKYKSEQVRLAKIVEHNRAAQIDHELPGEPKLVEGPSSLVEEYYERKSAREDAAELAPMGSTLDAMAAAIRARK
jgi:hypothetical protein